jgi:uncharacterized damage-inducible protein DinB
MIEIIQTMYRYNAWANARILSTTGQITPEQTNAETNPSFGSIHNTLIHILNWQWQWLYRWKGDFPKESLDPRAFADLKMIQARWDEVEKETNEFVLTCKQNDLSRIIAYTNPRGEKRSNLLWQQMIHQVNHATQHRSEIALILTGCGFSPGPMDLLVFVNLENLNKGTFDSDRKSITY